MKFVVKYMFATSDTFGAVCSNQVRYAKYVVAYSDNRRVEVVHVVSSGQKVR